MSILLFCFLVVFSVYAFRMLLGLSSNFQCVLGITAHIMCDCSLINWYVFQNNFSYRFFTRFIHSLWWLDFIIIAGTNRGVTLKVSLNEVSIQRRAHFESCILGMAKRSKSAKWPQLLFISLYPWHPVSRPCEQRHISHFNSKVTLEAGIHLLITKNSDKFYI